MAKKQTYAQKAKAIMNKYKPRLGEKFDKGDTLALEAMNQELEALREGQEAARIQEQEDAVNVFANGGDLNKKQRQTLGTLLANRNTPFVQNILAGNDQRLQVGVNELGQPAVFPRRFPGSEEPVVGQQLNQAGVQQNSIPFGDMKTARKFKRSLPKALDKLERPLPENPRNFAIGGNLGGGGFEDVPKRQRGTLGNLALAKNTPFASSLLQGQQVPLSQGQFNQQQIVYPSNLPLEQAGMQGNFIPFGQDPRAARKFMRQAPKVSDRVGRKRFSGSERPNYYGGPAQVGGPSSVNAQMAGPITYATGGLLPMYQGPGESPNYLGQRPWTAQDYRFAGQTANAGFNQIPYGQPAYPYSQYFGDVMLDNARGLTQPGYNWRNPSPYDLIQGRSPMDPLQRGRFAQPYTQNPVMMDLTRPGRASFGNIDPRLQGDIYDGGEIPGVTITGRPTTPTGGSTAATAVTPAATPTNPADLAPSPVSLGNTQMPFNPGVYDQMPANSAQAMAQIQASEPLGQEIGDPFEFRAPWFPALTAGVGSILGNRQLDLPNFEDVQDLRAQEIMPRLVDYRRGREQTMRERDLAQAMVRRAAKGRGTQQGVTGSTIAGSTATQRQAGSAFNRSLEAQENENARIRNQAAQFNAQQRARAGETNLRSALMRGQYERENALINAQRRTNQIAGITGAITGYGRDLLQANRDTGFMRLQEDPEYPIQQRNDALWKRILGWDADPFKEYTGPVRPIGQITQR